MRNIKYTKNPSVKQLLDMTFNLREKFNGRPAKISIEAWSFSSGASEVDFQIYVEDRDGEVKIGRIIFSTWSECQNHYIELMRLEND